MSRTESMKRCRFHILASLLTGVGLICLAHGASAAHIRDDKTLNDAIKTKLSQNVSVQFDETPLTEVIDYFRTELDINIVYDPPEHEDVEKLINLNVTKMTAGTALRWATKLAGLESDIVGGVVYISTRDRVTQMGARFMEQYDVRDLLATPRSLRDRRNRNNNDDNNDDGNRNNNDNDDDNDRSSAEDLLRLLVLFTGPENWDHVEVLGISSRNDNTESESREDYF